MPVDPELSKLLRAAGSLGANSRVLDLDDEGRRDMTAAARETALTNKAARKVELLKQQVDPNGELDEEERTRRALNLFEAARAKAQLDKIRRERRLRRVEDALTALIEDDAEALTA